MYVLLCKLGHRSGVVGLMWTGMLVLTFVGCQYTDTELSWSSKHSVQAIVGGQPDLQHPAVGALVRDQIVFCSGTLIAHRVVLTAAHCIDSAFQYHIGKNHLQFRIDTVDSLAPGGYRTHFFDIEFSLLSRHPQWQSHRVQQGYDVGIAVLRNPVPTVVATPIPFHDSPLVVEDWQGKDAFFLGYGLILSVPYAISPNRKYAAWLKLEEIKPDHVVIRSAGKSVCHGDSGGPALGQINGQWRVLAVNSYALTDMAQGSNPPRTRCEGGAVGVRTDVYKSYLQSWVDRFKVESLSCQTDADCGSCGTCSQNSQCSAKAISSQNRTCLPCRQHNDCNGGLCQIFPEGRRCMGLCDKDSCCPANTVCREFSDHTTQRSLCVPWSESCPPASCQTDGDCSDLETCQTGQCTRKAVRRVAKQCYPCQTNEDCGDSQLACTSLSGERRCLPLCPNQICPADMACQQNYPGQAKVCMPQDTCEISCQSQTDCPSAWTCQNNRCLISTLAQAGESCRQRACASDLDCLDVLGEKRCLRACRIAAGQPGGACLGERTCSPGHSCLGVRGLKYKFCVTQCQTSPDCVLGGACTRGFCVCRTTQDCANGAVCETGFGADTGFCVKPNQLPACRVGERCEFLTQGSYCVPEQSTQTRTIGQSCNALFGCHDSLACVEFGRQAGVCMEMCSSNQWCRLGGTCEQGYCFCKQSSDCPSGRECQLFLDIPARVGICIPTSLSQPQTNTPCVDDRECDRGLTCVQGMCVSAEIPEEPTSSQETGSLEIPQTEAFVEQISSQESSQDAGLAESSSLYEPSSSVDMTSSLQDATPPPRHCGCNMAFTVPLWGQLLWFLVGWMCFGVFVLCSNLLPPRRF